MPDNSLTFETARGVPMQENAVTETVVSGAFPTGFSNNTVSGAQNDVMVIIDTTLLTSKQGAINQLSRIIKMIEQSVNFAS